MYDEKSLLDTFILRKDLEDDFQLYAKKHHEEISEKWESAIFIDNNFAFEIVEEKLTNDLKNALKVLGKYCEKRNCGNCAFFNGNYNGNCCDLTSRNSYENYIKYVGEENE